MKEITIEDVLLKHGIYPNSMMPEYRNGILAAMTEYASLNRQGWTRVDKSKPETYPPKNLGVIVFIPEEDFHITSGMWDVSEVWVLLDEYRKPECEVTHWMYSPEIPNEYQKEVKENNQVMKALKYLLPPKKLSELTDDIRMKQILSAEELVIENLKKKGLI